jgi:hypothetical protein
MFHRNACGSNDRVLNITGLDLALLTNFKNARLEWKRVLRTQETQERVPLDLHA